jgi:hypothetical protein
MSPSFMHEALVRLFRERPQLAAEVLRDQLQIDVPSYTEAIVQPSELGQLTPVELRADLVVLFRDGAPVMVIVVEVQLGKDPEKRRRWPLYLAAARDHYRCDAYVLVVTPNASVARWAREPIRLGGNSVVEVHVLGPETIPPMTNLEQAKHHPELAVISALANAENPVGPAIALAAVNALNGVDDDFSALYYDLILSALPEAARAALEELMIQGYEYQSDFAKKYYGEGKAEGEAKGKADAILAVLAARSMAVTEAQRATLLATHDLAQLDLWLIRAATCAEANEVFAS